MSMGSSFNGHRIILASASPRRKELLQQIGLKVEIIPSKFEENLPKSSFAKPADYVVATAKGKAAEVWGENKDAVVIGADTVVVIDNKILEKPNSVECAREMLSELSGRIHHVITGVCICYHDNKHTFHVETEVKFAELSKDLKDWYVGTGESFDKAGGYGIQSQGAVLVEKISGCYFNVVGLPVQKLYVELHRLLQNQSQ